MTIKETTVAPSPTVDDAPRPDHKRRRIAGVDMTRGLAIIGMIAVHSLSTTGADGLPATSFLISAGNAAATFAVLAGVSISFITRRRRLTSSPEDTGTAAALLTRAALIGIVGLCLGYTDSDYGVVILFYYALMFAIAVPLTYLSTRWVVAITVAIAVGMPVLSHLLRLHFQHVELGQISVSLLLDDPGSAFRELFLTGEYPVIVWMAYFGVGIVVGRLTLSSARVARRLLCTGLGLFVVARAASWALVTYAASPALDPSSSDFVWEMLHYGGDGVAPTDSWWWLTIASAHTGTTFDLASTTGVALFVLGAFLLLDHVRRGGLPTLLVSGIRVPLAAIGSMSLTLYVAHIVFINSDADTYSPIGGFTRQIVVMIVFAIAWKLTAGRGPLESLLTTIINVVRRRTTAQMIAAQDKSGRIGTDENLGMTSDNTQSATSSTASSGSS